LISLGNDFLSNEVKEKLSKWRRVTETKLSYYYYKMLPYILLRGNVTVLVKSN